MPILELRSPQRETNFKKAPVRLILDVSSAIRWIGPPVGIARVAQELARYVRAERPDIVLAYYDPLIGFRALRPQWANIVLDPRGTIDPVRLARKGPGQELRWWHAPRYPIMEALERGRLTASSSPRAEVAAMLQSLLMLGRVKAPFVDSTGHRVAVVHPSLALEDAPLALGPGDTLVLIDTWNKKTDEIAMQKRQLRFRLVALCYDLIPLTYPEFYSEEDVKNFRHFWDTIFVLADLVMVNSQSVRSDVLRYCRANAIPTPDAEVVPLGYDLPPSTDGNHLPRGLEPSRFALMVATIEPRKGHAMLLEIWQRLLAEGIPQRHGFKLVFVGRPGWKVEDLLRRIERAGEPEGMFLYFGDLSDAVLPPLYREAAFCVLPSISEGYGLPIIEAFSFGKAVLASSGGALPELVGDLSPCLDPSDSKVWYQALRRWIEDPGQRHVYEQRIRSSFSHPTWQEASARFFAAVEGSDPEAR